nr:reverse transcriptase domain-containing protein [Tanacetum cinerariifolium]
MTNAQLKALIDQGVADALAARDTDRSWNGKDNHDSRTGVRRQAPLACGNDTAPTKVYGVDRAGINPESNVVMGTFLLKNRYACILFDTGVDRSFVSTAFSSQIAITPTTLGHYYDVELADRRIIRLNSILSGYTLNFLNHPFNIDLMPIKLGSFDAIIGMDWLAKYHVRPRKRDSTSTMQDAIEFTTKLMDKKISTFTERQDDNKRKFDDTSKNNQNQLQPTKRQNVARAYTAGSSEKKPYGGSKPLCSKCNYHHDGECASKGHKCNRVGHLARGCRSPTNANNNNHQRSPRANPGVLTCFECGAHGHFKKDCPKLKNGNQVNQVRVGNDVARAYAVGTARTNPNANVVMGTFLLNNRYASILFDIGTDRSFVSNAFISLIDIIPTTLDHDYDVEIANERIIKVNTIIWGCTLNFLNHPFIIDLMPAEIGSFDVIIGMDWLSKYEAVIVYSEKIVHVPFGNEILIVREQTKARRASEANLGVAKERGVVCQII